MTLVWNLQWGLYVTYYVCACDDTCLSWIAPAITLSEGYCKHARAEAETLSESLEHYQIRSGKGDIDCTAWLGRLCMGAHLQLVLHVWWLCKLHLFVGRVKVKDASPYCAVLILDLMHMSKTILFTCIALHWMWCVVHHITLQVHAVVQDPHMFTDSAISCLKPCVSLPICVFYQYVFQAWGGPNSKLPQLATQSYFSGFKV